MDLMDLPHSAAGGGETITCTGREGKHYSAPGIAFSTDGRCLEVEFWGYFEPFIYNLYIVLGKSVTRHVLRG